MCHIANFKRTFFEINYPNPIKQNSPLFQILDENGYLDDFSETFDGKITQEDIMHNLINLPQVVFEVTSSCNLRCEYCCYGSGYDTFSHRHKGNLSIDKAKAMLDFLSSLFKDEKNESQNIPFVVSFYGGEPLLNFHLIEQIVEYAKTLDFSGRILRFSMTTNATYLYQHIDFLANNDFSLLVSLDGDKYADSYRKMADGKESFELVVDNLKKVKEHYPDFYETIRFNAVYTNRNDFRRLIDFFTNKIGKAPNISLLHETNESAEDYEKIKEMRKDLIPTDASALKPDIFLEIPIHKRIIDIFTKLLHDVFIHDIDCFTSNNMSKYPTGTCIPFSKRLFVSNDGKILPCEKISRDIPLGVVYGNKVDLSLQLIADRFNSSMINASEICTKCYLQKNCNYCVFMSNGKKCQHFMNEKSFSKMLSKVFSYVEEHPQIEQLVYNNFIIR